MSLPLIFSGIQSALSAIGSIGPALQAALSIGSTAATFAVNKANANAQEAAIAQADNDARMQAISDYDQLTRVGMQERAAATGKITENAIATKKAVASATASAGESNVGGLSVTALLTDIYGQSARIQDGVNQNVENANAQLQTDFANTGRGLKNTIMTRPQVQKPSLIGALIEGTSGVVNAYKDTIKVKSKL